MNIYTYGLNKNPKIKKTNILILYIINRIDKEYVIYSIYIMIAISFINQYKCFAATGDRTSALWRAAHLFGFRAAT